MTRACVIGAGFGGLALAIRLQAAGIETVVVEARDRPGGRACAWQREGFTFDAGPTAIPDRAPLEALWALTGHALADDVTLLPVMPYCRYNWPDGTIFDLGPDGPELRAAIERLAPGDLAGYEEFRRHAAAVRTEERPSPTSYRDFAGMLRAAPSLARHQAWRSVNSLVASFVNSDRLREALSFDTLLTGGNTFATSGITAAPPEAMWTARGGIGEVVAGMVRHFERLGGTLRLHDPVLQVHAIGNRVTEVECQSGWRERFSAIASNADVVHTYRDLLGDSVPARDTARKLARKRFSPSMFVVHFGLEGSWPGIPHRTVLFGPRWRGLIADIFDHGVLPRDFACLLSHPSVTDPGLAPEGKSAFSAAIPVAHLGKLPLDWEAIGPMLERRVLDEVGRRLIPDIHDRLVTSFHYTPRDWALDLTAHLGSAFGLEPVPTQSGPFRPRNRDARIANLYLAGAATHPGAGVAGVMASARATAALMLGDLAA